MTGDELQDRLSEIDALLGPAADLDTRCVPRAVVLLREAQRALRDRPLAERDDVAWQRVQQAWRRVDDLRAAATAQAASLATALEELARELPPPGSDIAAVLGELRARATVTLFPTGQERALWMERWIEVATSAGVSSTETDLCRAVDDALAASRGARQLGAPSSADATAESDERRRRHSSLEDASRAVAGARLALLNATTLTRTTRDRLWRSINDEERQLRFAWAEHHRQVDDQRRGRVVERIEALRETRGRKEDQLVRNEVLLDELTDKLARARDPATKERTREWLDAALERREALRAAVADLDKKLAVLEGRLA